jgi:hypothetical protein
MRSALHRWKRFCVSLEAQTKRIGLRRRGARMKAFKVWAVLLSQVSAVKNAARNLGHPTAVAGYSV